MSSRKHKRTAAGHRGCNRRAFGLSGRSLGEGGWPPSLINIGSLGIRARVIKLLATLALAGFMTHAVFAADQEFPVYTPRATVGGRRADRDFPIIDTPAYKGAIVPAEEA